MKFTLSSKRPTSPCAGATNPVAKADHLMKKRAMVLFFSLCVSAGLLAAELSVYAAASLTDPMKEIGATYESGDSCQS
jgi:hypothetical protein